MLNLVCRDSVLRRSVLERLRGVFSPMFSRKIAGEVNEVLLCCRGDGATEEDRSSPAPAALPSAAAASSLQEALCSPGGGGAAGHRHAHIDISDLLKDLKVA